MASLTQPPFSSSSPWNTLIPSQSVYTSLNWPSSTGYNYTVSWASYSPAVYVATAADPLVTVSYPASWGYPGGTVSVHMPLAANGAVGTDGELIVIDNGIAYNFWEFNRTGPTAATALAIGEDNVLTGSGFGVSSPFLGAGITAIGSSELGGLLTQTDQSNGLIDHALQLVVDSKLVKPGFTGVAISGDGSSATGIVQEGELLGISPNTPMPTGLSPLGQEVFTALQDYGAYVVDVASGDTAIRVQSNAFDSATMTALWHDMGSIATLLSAVTPATHPAPTILNVSTSGSRITNGAGVVGVGATIHISVQFSENVNVVGSPSLSLNSGGVAKYVSGSGKSALQFVYTVKAGQNAADLAVASFNLSGVTDAAGVGVSLSGAPTAPAGILTVRTTSAPKLGNSNTVTSPVLLNATSEASGRQLTGAPAKVFDVSNRTIDLATENAVVNGSYDKIDFNGDDAVTANGTHEIFSFPAALGLSTISGFNSTDVISLPSIDFAGWQALQPHIAASGANTTITLDAKDIITLTDIAPASLKAANFKFA